LINKHELTLGIDFKNAYRRVGGQGSITVFAGPERLLGPFAVGDVIEGAGDTRIVP
jgi:hypothetical protein